VRRCVVTATRQAGIVRGGITSRRTHPALAPPPRQRTALPPARYGLQGRCMHAHTNALQCTCKAGPRHACPSPCHPHTHTAISTKEKYSGVGTRHQIVPAQHTPPHMERHARRATHRWNYQYCYYAAQCAGHGSAVGGAEVAECGEQDGALQSLDFDSLTAIYSSWERVRSLVADALHRAGPVIVQ
jgi:hypothetical protein